jgi:hypothetical protein
MLADMAGKALRLALGICIATGCASNGGGGVDSPAHRALESTMPTNPTLNTADALSTSPMSPVTAMRSTSRTTPTADASTTTKPTTTSATMPTTTTEPRPELFDDSPEVAPGNYVVDRLAVPIAITVPPGWMTFADIALLGPDGSYLAFWNILDVYLDACRWKLGQAGIGPTVADLVAGLVAQVGTETAEPRSIEVDGYTGTELGLSSWPSLDFAACDDGEFNLWTQPDGPERGHIVPGETETLWILDLDGSRGVINFGSFGPMTPAAGAQIADMLASLDIG